MISKSLVFAVIFFSVNLRHSIIYIIILIYLTYCLILSSSGFQLKQIVCGCLISSDELSKAINLLLKLGVQSSTVYSDFLASCKRNLSDQLTAMRTQRQVHNEMWFMLNTAGFYFSPCDCFRIQQMF